MPSSAGTASFRRARASDAAQIASLIQRYVPSGMLLPRTEEFIAERAMEFIVAEAAEHVIGSVHLEEYSPTLAEVRSLVVHPDWQSRGIGSELLRTLEQLAMVREYAILFAVSNNEGFFRAQGYEPREIPELDRQRSEISRFKGVFAKDVRPPAQRGSGGR